MEKTDSYLLMLVGLLVIALIAVELIPMPQPSAPGLPSKSPGKGPLYGAPILNSGAIASVLVMPSSTVATVSVK